MASKGGTMQTAQEQEPAQGHSVWDVEFMRLQAQRDERALRAEAEDAFLEAQQEMQGIDIIKDSTNPHFRNDYSSLKEHLDKLVPIYNRHRIGVTMESRVDGTNTIFTFMLMFKWLAFRKAEWCVKEGTAQNKGSELTYLRRYLLQGVSGVASAKDDDDANRASGIRDDGNHERRPAAKPAPAPAPADDVAF